MGRRFESYHRSSYCKIIAPFMGAFDFIYRTNIITLHSKVLTALPILGQFSQSAQDCQTAGDFSAK